MVEIQTGLQTMKNLALFILCYSAALNADAPAPLDSDNMQRISHILPVADPEEDDEHFFEERMDRSVEPPETLKIDMGQDKDSDVVNEDTRDPQESLETDKKKGRTKGRSICKQSSGLRSEGVSPGASLRQIDPRYLKESISYPNKTSVWEQFYTTDKP